jgi:hypothetical protein
MTPPCLPTTRRPAGLDADRSRWLPAACLMQQTIAAAQPVAGWRGRETSADGRAK